jgi:hypothetical protein
MAALVTGLAPKSADIRGENPLLSVTEVHDKHVVVPAKAGTQ